MADVKRYRAAVCKGPDCRRNGSDAVFQELKRQVDARGLAARCEVYRGGCYGLCDLGPNLVVREDTRKRDPLSPEDFQLMGWEGEHHYGAMSPQKVERIVNEHLTNDAPVIDSGDPAQPR